MAVDKVLCLKERYQDTSKFTVHDTSEWLDEAPDRREDAARFLVAAKMDENQQLTFIAVINDDPLNDLEWDITSEGVGAYRFFYISIPLWDDIYNQALVAEVADADGVITTHANFAYHNDTLYKVILGHSNNEPGVAADWETYWEEYNPANLYTQILSTAIDVHLHDDISTMEYEECIVEKVDAKTDGELCGACCTDQEFLNLMKMQFLLDAAMSNNWQGKATRSEVILKEASKKFCC
jgi:hypothetical protein